MVHLVRFTIDTENRRFGSIWTFAERQCAFIAKFRRFPETAVAAEER